MPLVPCARVPARQAEKIRQALLGGGLLATRYKVVRDAKHVYFPLVKGAVVPSSPIVTVARKRLAELPGTQGGSLKEELVGLGKIGAADAEKIISSFDVLGDIAIVEIPAELSRFERDIAGAILRRNPHVRVVARKDGAMRGKYRVRKMTVIAGERRTTTVYRESGCSFGLDAAKVYFSVRLAGERLRIASLVRPGEHVLIPFAGVGPFAIVIARKQPKAAVVGIELNPAAARSFGLNVKRNKLANVVAVRGDVAKVIPKRFTAWADRIAAPLPHSAMGFLGVMLKAAKPEGCTIHFYGFARTRDEPAGKPLADIYAPLVAELREKCAGAKMTCRVLGTRIVRPYAPYVVQVAVDIRVRKASAHRSTRTG